MLHTALRLAQKGLAVFPCRPHDKRPATANGLKDATTDPEAIAAWWQQDPNFNIAIATGAASGVFVVDVDGIDAEAALRRLEGRARRLAAERGSHHRARPARLLPDAGSRPAQFRQQDRARTSIRGPTAATCWPRRAFIPAVAATHGPSIAPAAFAAAPAWLLAKLVPPGRNGNGAAPASAWRELVKGVAEGARDCSATRLAGHLLRHRIDPLVALELLQSWNATRCDPPLPEADIERIVASIARKELQRRGHD